jgi:hypothetical protein
MNMPSKRRRNIKGILADPDLRRKLMVSTIQATQAREGIETTEEQADRAYYVVTEGEQAAFFDLSRFKGKGEGGFDLRHIKFVQSLGDGVEGIRFNVARRDFSSIEGAPLAYGRVGFLAHIFREIPPLDPVKASVVQGLATADDNRFVRCWWEIPADWGGRGQDWVPFAKGGEFSRFYADIYLSVQWAEKSIKVMRDKGRVQNVDYYFKPGLTWRLAASVLNVRILPEGCIFGHKGPAIFINKDIDQWIIAGLLNSEMALCFGKTLTSREKMGGRWEVGVLRRFPIPDLKTNTCRRIGEISRRIYDVKAMWDQGNEVSTQFNAPWVLNSDIISFNEPIRKRLDLLVEYEVSENNGLQSYYADLNNEVYRLYQIPERTRVLIEETLGGRPPEILWPQMEGKSVEQKRMEHVWRLLSYIVKRVVEKDEDGIVPFDPIPGESGLMDRVYNELEILFPEQSVSQVEVEIVNELKRNVKGYRSVQTIREWMEDIYFHYHVSFYKKRPIFWHISSKQGRGRAAFGALVHYHRFDKNAMAKLRGTYLRDAIEGFRREAALAAQEGRGEDRIEWQAKLEEVQELDRRLQWVQEGYHEGSEGGEHDFRILTPWKPPDEQPKGWDPDIDDGVKVNIEPLKKGGGLRVNP